MLGEVVLEVGEAALLDERRQDARVALEEDCTGQQECRHDVRDDPDGKEGKKGGEGRTHRPHFGDAGQGKQALPSPLGARLLEVGVDVPDEGRDEEARCVKDLAGRVLQRR